MGNGICIFETVRGVTRYALHVTGASRHCELRGTKQEAIHEKVTSYTETHREPQRTTEIFYPFISIAIASHRFCLRTT
jgi:hypothetical protein